jgi:hypothetical protein
MKATRHFARTLIVIAALLVFTLAYAELFVRIFDPQPMMPRYVTGTSWGVRGNIPDAQYRHNTPEVDVEMRINGQGMRADRDYPVVKQPGLCRVALFGDSFFMGYELDYDDTYAVQLEKMLRQHDLNAEVLNFAVSGFGTAEMVRTYESFGRQFQPDLVIFQWHSTDPDDNVRSNLYRLHDNHLLATGASYLPSVKLQNALMRSSIYTFVADNSHLYSVIREQTAVRVKSLLEKVRQANATASVGDENSPEKENIESLDSGVTAPYSVRLSEALLRHADQTIRAENRGFLVVEIPIRVNPTTFRSSIAVLRKEQLGNLEVVSPLASFRSMASPAAKLYFERGQGHITPLAVQQLVSVTVDAVIRDGKLRSCPSPESQT